MSLPSVSAVVVVHGSPASTVDACIASLLASAGVDLHIILVDNASPDGGAACAAWNSFPTVTVVTSTSNNGFAAGVNQALPLVRKSDWVMLLNDDATVAPTALATLIDSLRRHDTAIAAAPRVMLANDPDRIDSLGLVVRPSGEAFNAYIGQPWAEQLPDGADILGPCFGAAMFRPDAFEPDVVGPLDERYFLYYEDVDWVLRAQRRGNRCVLATDAVVFHQHAASTRALGEHKRYELVQRNLLLCATKNLAAHSALLVWWQRLVVQAKGTITGPYRAARGRSLLRALGGLPDVVRARRRLGRERARPDAELFAYAAGLSPQFDVDTYRATP